MLEGNVLFLGVNFLIAERYAEALHVELMGNWVKEVKKAMLEHVLVLLNSYPHYTGSYYHEVRNLLLVWDGRSLLRVYGDRILPKFLEALLLV